MIWELIPPKKLDVTQNDLSPYCGRVRHRTFKLYLLTSLEFDVLNSLWANRAKIYSVTIFYFAIKIRLIGIFKK